MLIKKPAEEIFKDIKQQGFKLGVTAYEDGSFDVSTAFGEIFIRVDSDKQVSKLFFDLEALDDGDNDMFEIYKYTTSYILKNWIEF